MPQLICMHFLSSLRMNFILKTSLLLLAWAPSLSATALDDYVWAADDNYKWVDMVRFSRLQCVEVVHFPDVIFHFLT